MHTKRDISLPKGREVKDSKIKYIKKLLGKLPIKRDMLIEALHLIQRIPLEHLKLLLNH